MVDPVRIEERLRLLEQYQRILGDVSRKPEDQTAKDPLAIGAVKYYLQVSIEACLDIAHHVISSRRLRPPTDYADSFTVLCEVGILPEDFAARLKEMARFRNRLVHIYGEVDDRMVLRTLRENLEDFTHYRNLILPLLAE